MDETTSSSDSGIVFPAQRTGEQPNFKLQISQALTQSLFVFSVIFLSFLVIAMTVLRGRLKQNFFNLSVSNLAVGGIVSSLFIRPITIQEEISTEILSSAFCGFYLTFLNMEQIFIPCILITLTTERLIAIKEPEKYNKRFATPVKISLLLIPWLWGLTYGLLRNFVCADNIIAHYGSFPNDGYYNTHTLLSSRGCMLVFNDGDTNGYQIMHKVFAFAIPTTILTCGSIMLLIFFCKSKRTTRTELDLEKPNVYPSSVIYCLILNMVMVIILITDAITLDFVASWANPHWKICWLELLVAILSLTSLPDLRRTMTSACCCYGHQEDEDFLIPVTNSEPETD